MGEVIDHIGAGLKPNVLLLMIQVRPHVFVHYDGETKNCLQSTRVTFSTTS
jgi:hypothetical protein